jgi:PAS domain S-box-containing protein
MLNSIRRFFAAPAFEGDEEKTRTARILNTILYSLVILVVGGTLAGVIASLITNQPTDISQGIVPLLLFIGLIVLMRLGFVRQVSFALAFVLSATTTQSLFTAGMWTPTVIAGYLLAISIAGLLAGGWSSLTIAVFSLLSLGGFNYLITQGVTQAQPLVINDFVGAGAFFSISAFLLSLSHRSTREALAKARQNELAQIKANQELVGLQATLEQRVAERTQALTTVAEISTTASTTLETEKLMQQVVDLSKERFGLYHSHIYLLNELGDKLVLASGAGEPGRMMVAQKHAIPLHGEQSLVARAAREQRGVIVNDVTQEPDFLPNPILPDTRAELAVPMIVGEKVIGVFDVQSEIIGRFTEADIAVQSTLATQVASAVQNTRLYTQAETIAQEARSLVDNAPETIIIVDLETGLFINPNENAVKLYGLEREELIKVGPAQMSPPRQPDGRDSTEKAMEKIGEAMQGGTPIFEWVHRNAQGEDIPCEIRLVRMPGDHPRVRASVTDISERKRNEDLTRQRAQQQEALNLITQKIQGATTIEAALQVTARELGRALGRKPTLVTLEPDSTNGKRKADS